MQFGMPTGTPGRYQINIILSREKMLEKNYWITGVSHGDSLGFQAQIEDLHMKLSCPPVGTKDNEKMYLIQ